MYNSENVETFLRVRKTKPSVLTEIKKRMKEVADQDGDFLSRDLVYVLGPELTEAYEKDCAKNPGLMWAQKVQQTEGRKDLCT